MTDTVISLRFRSSLTHHSKASIRTRHGDVIKWKHFSIYWPFVREFTGHRWIPISKTSDKELWCFLWSESERTVGQNIETPAIWDAHRAHYDVTLMAEWMCINCTWANARYSISVTALWFNCIISRKIHHRTHTLRYRKQTMCQRIWQHAGLYVVRSSCRTHTAICDSCIVYTSNTLINTKTLTLLSSKTKGGLNVIQLEFDNLTSPPFNKDVTKYSYIWRPIDFVTICFPMARGYDRQNAIQRTMSWWYHWRDVSLLLFTANKHDTASRIMNVFNQHRWKGHASN